MKKYLLIILLGFNCYSTEFDFKYDDWVEVKKQSDVGRFYKCSKKGQVIGYREIEYDEEGWGDCEVIYEVHFDCPSHTFNEGHCINNLKKVEK